MSGAIEEQLYGLITVATRQQESVQKALDGLAAERAALERERQALARNVEALRQSTQNAVRVAVRDSLGEATATITGQAEIAFAPTLKQLSGVLTTAQKAEGVLRGLIEWASWRLFGQVVAFAVFALVLMWVTSSAILWWDAGAIGQAQQQKFGLQADIAVLGANYDDWKKAGMLGKLEHCGSKRRLCIRTDDDAGTFGGNSDYRVIYGY